MNVQLAYKYVIHSYLQWKGNDADKGRRWNLIGTYKETVGQIRLYKSK